MSKPQRQEFRDWPSRNSDVVRSAEALVGTPIDSDMDYISLRASLPPDISYPCDIRRYQEWRKTGSALIDSGPLVKILPPAILSTVIESSMVSVRVHNVLSRLKINTVNDLSKYSILEALKWPNFGRKSLAVLLAMLDDVVSDIPPPTNEHDAIVIHKREGQAEPVVESVDVGAPREGVLGDGAHPAYKPRLYEAVITWLETLPHRNRMIMDSRLGFGGTPLTLQAVGTKFEITRERVRQVESKAIRNARLNYDFAGELVTRLNRLLAGRVAPLLVDAIWSEDVWFSGFAGKPHFFKSIIEGLSNGEFRVIRSKGLRFISRLSQDDWKELVSSAKNIARIAHQQRWMRKDYDTALESLTAQRNAEELTSFLKDTISSRVHFARSKDGVDVIVGFGHGVDHMVSVILNEAEQPLHYQEIHQRLIKKYGKDVDVRRVHSGAQRIDAILFALGTYGVGRHVQLDEKELEIVRDTAEETILAGEQERQWHSTELVDVVVEVHPEMEGRIDQYMVNYALQKSDALTYLGRSVWALAKSHHMSSHARIAVNEAFVSILRDAGTPLHADELMNRLVQRRGVSGVCQITANDRIIPVKPATWGLIGRDVVLGDGGVTGVMDKLYRLVQETGHGADKEILRSKMQSTKEEWGKGVNEYVLISLAGSDSRFGVHRGQAIFLKEWGNPRYKTIRELVRQAVDKMQLPAPIERIVSEVQSIASRTITRDNVYGYLRDQGLRFNESIQMWEMTDTEDVA